MKKFVLWILVLTMVLGMAGCGCEHVAGEAMLTEVDTAKLTAKWEVSCTQCGKQMEPRDTTTGVAPVDSTVRLSPQDWFACLPTNIKPYDTSRMLVPMAAESEDNAQLYSVVSPSGFKSVISFFDKEDVVITTDRSTEAGNIHRIRIEAQFDNDTSVTFYTLLLLMAMTNNGEWTNEGVNALCQQIMGGETVSDNGYTYSLQILSAENHTVAVNIVAE